NVVTLFAAALLPGLLAVLFFIATIALYVRAVPDSGPEGSAVSVHEFRRATLGMAPVFVVFGVVIGGIYAGVYNPTPAAAIGVFLVGLYGTVMRRLSLRATIAALLAT